MRTLLFIICTVMCIVSVNSCQQEFGDPTFVVIPPASSTDTFKVTVNGNNFPTYSILTTTTSNTINIVASDVQAFRKVSITVPSTVVAGSYPLDFSTMIYFGIYYPDTSVSLISNSGNITIIENNLISKRIRGMFNFDGQPSSGGTTFAQLTGGYFSIKYP